MLIVGGASMGVAWLSGGFGMGQELQCFLILWNPLA